MCPKNKVNHRLLYFLSGIYPIGFGIPFDLPYRATQVRCFYFFYSYSHDPL